MRTVSLFVCLFLAQLASAQSCGDPPNANYVASSDWKKAVLKVTQSGRTQTINSSATVPIDGVPVKFGLDGSQTITQSDLDAMSEQQAQTIIHNEIANNRTALLAECRYGFCSLSAQASSNAAAAIDALTKVCLAATPSTSGFVADPASFNIVFNGVSPLRYTTMLVNNTPGDVQVNVGPSAHVSYVGTSPILLKHGEPTFVTLSVKQIPTNDELKEGLTFVATNDVTFRNQVSFDIAGSPNAKLPGPTLPCGSLNEHGVAIAVPDVHKGFSDKRVDQNSWTTLNSGQTNLPLYGSEYTNNGGGQANLQSATATCSQVTDTRTTASKSIAIRADLYAKAGHCCSGQGPGGVVNFAPEWTSNFTLPGTIGKNSWAIRLDSSVTKVGTNARCSWSLDNLDKGTLSASGTSNASVTGIAPGTHTISMSCTANDWHFGAQGGPGWDREVRATDSVNMLWTVTRTDQ